MDLQFPTLFYRCPGIHFGTRATYDFFPVENEEVAQQALDNDCFPTLPEAESAFLDKPQPIAIPIIAKETKKGKKQPDPLPSDSILPPSDELDKTENDLSQSEQQPDQTNESTSDSDKKDQ